MTKPKESKTAGGSLADMIMQKLATGDFADGDEMDDDEIERNAKNGGGVDTFDPKIVAAYKKLGVVLKTYRSGKLPKAFKVIP